MEKMFPYFRDEKNASSEMTPNHLIDSGPIVKSWSDGIDSKLAVFTESLIRALVGFSLVNVC